MGEQLPGTGGDRLGDGRPLPQPGPPLFGTRACLAFGAGGPVQGVRPSGQSLDPLLVRTDLETGLHLGLPGVGTVGGEPVAGAGVGFLLDRELLGDGEPLGQLLHVRQRLVQRLLRPGRGGGGPFRLTGGAPGLAREPAQLLGDGRLLAVGGPAPLPQLLDERRALPPPSDGRLLCPGQRLAPHAQLLQFGGGPVHGRLHLQEAGRPGRTALREVRAEQVAVGGHGGQSGPGVDEVLGVLQGVHDDDPAQQPPYGGHQVGRTTHEIGGVRGPVTARLVRYVVGSAGEQQRGPARVLLAQQAYGVGGGRRGGHREGVGGGTESGGEGGLVAGRDGEQLGDRSEQAGEPVPRGEHRSGAVLSAQSERERLVAGLGGGAGAFRRGGLFAGGGEGGLRLGQPALGGLVPLGEFLVVGVEPVDLGLEGLVLLLGGGGPLLGRVACLGQPLDLGLRGGGARTGGADLPAEAGQALAAVGDGAGGVLEAALLLGQLAFEVRAVGDGVLQGVLGRLQGRFEFGLLLPDAGGLALQLLRVAATAFLGRRGGGALHAGVGE